MKFGSKRNPADWSNTFSWTPGKTAPADKMRSCCSTSSTTIESRSNWSKSTMKRTGTTLRLSFIAGKSSVCVCGVCFLTSCIYNPTVRLIEKTAPESVEPACSSPSIVSLVSWANRRTSLSTFTESSSKCVAIGLSWFRRRWISLWSKAAQAHETLLTMSFFPSPTHTQTQYIFVHECVALMVQQLFPHLRRQSHPTLAASNGHIGFDSNNNNELGREDSTVQTSDDLQTSFSSARSQTSLAFSNPSYEHESTSRLWSGKKRTDYNPGFVVGKSGAYWETEMSVPQSASDSRAVWWIDRLPNLVRSPDQMFGRNAESVINQALLALLPCIHLIIITPVFDGPTSCWQVAPNRKISRLPTFWKLLYKTNLLQIVSLYVLFWKNVENGLIKHCLRKGRPFTRRVFVRQMIGCRSTLPKRSSEFVWQRLIPHRDFHLKNASTPFLGWEDSKRVRKPHSWVPPYEFGSLHCVVNDGFF